MVWECLNLQLRKKMPGYSVTPSFESQIERLPVIEITVTRQDFIQHQQR